MAAGTYRIFIGNQWHAGKMVKIVRSPFDGSSVGEVHFAGEDQLDYAIQIANQAFRSTRMLSTAERAELLEQLEELLKGRKEEFAQMIMKEGGKPIRFARNEVERAILTLRSAVDVLRTMKGEILPLDISPQTRGVTGFVRRVPVGPILGITPFNFPLNLVMHKLAPSVAMGNPIIIKPSSQTPITALMLAELIQQADFPPGLVNIVPCEGVLAEKMASDHRIKMVSFTGSAATGWNLKQKCHNKRVSLELGGNAAAIVADDAPLDFAVPRLALGAMAHAGQICISVQRIYVQETIFEQFRDHFLKEVQDHIMVGNPALESTIVGPIIDESNLNRIDQWVKESLQEGADLLLGGKKIPPFYSPTVLTNTTPSMKVWKEEIFAPVVLIEPYKTMDEAIDLVNQSVYGLQAGVFTNRMTDILKCYRDLEAGGIIVNDYPTFRIDPMPYGGVKKSGFGREGLQYAMEEMSELKLLVIREI